MRIIHSGGFPEDERHQTRAVIYSNLVIAFKVLLDIMNAENIGFEHESSQVSYTWLLLMCQPPFLIRLFQPLAQFLDNVESDVGSEEAFSDLKIRDGMKNMWKDAGVQKAVARGHEFALHDNLH